MGSGIVFVVIIGLWAVILVPMWLRSHDAATESKSVDRFSTAMRTLSRRSTGPASSRDLVMPGRTRTVELSGGRAPSAAARRDDRAADMRRRRRRTVLIGLGAMFLVFLLAAGVGAAPLWLPLVALVGTGAYVVNLRKQTVESAKLERRRHRAVPQPMPVAAPQKPSRPVRTAAVVVPQAPTWPVAREERVDVDLTATATAAVVEAETYTDTGWAPTPVVLPTYVTAPPATSVPRVIDLTHPGAWSAAHMLEHAAGLNVPDPDEIFDGRAPSEEQQLSAYDAVVAEQQAVAAIVPGSTARPFLEEDAVFDQEDEAFLSLLDRRAAGD